MGLGQAQALNPPHRLSTADPGNLEVTSGSETCWRCASRWTKGSPTDHRRQKNRMDRVRPLSAQVEQHVLRWRTYRGRATAERFLSLLAVALQPRGWRLIRLYRPQDFPVPLLWIYTGGPDGYADYPSLAAVNA